MRLANIAAVALAPSVMAQINISSLVSEGSSIFHSITSDVKSLGGTKSLASEASAAVSSIASSLAAHPSEISSFESYYTSAFGTSYLPEITSAIASITSEASSKSGSNSAGAMLVPSYSISVMGAAAAGIFALAVAL